VRDAVTAGNADRVQELAAGADAAGLPPGFAVALGSYTMSKDADVGLRVLRAAWLAHPGYYPLARQIGFLVFSQAVNDPEAIQWFRLALGIRPDAEAYANLAFALFASQHGGKRRLTECEMAIRRAMDLGLNDALHHTLLGLILLQKPDVGGAEAAFRRALVLHPSDSSARVGLIRVYWERKDWDAVVRTMEELDRTTDDGPEVNYYLIGANVGTMWAITANLAATVGATRPWLVVRYYMKKEPKVDGDPVLDPKSQPDAARYGAACLAILVGSGVGADAPPPAEWPAIRRKAFEWLSAELAHWKGCVSLDPGANRDAARGAMNHWLGDADLRAVREDNELAKLPADERRQWAGFWAEVRSLRDRTAPPEQAPPPREIKP
jgi:tetratricopeptide (TPR) repeat protein